MDLERGNTFENADTVEKIFKAISIDIYDSIKQKQLFNRVIQLRHAIVHDGGIVTLDNWKKIGKTKRDIGNPIDYDNHYEFDGLVVIIYRSVTNIEFGMNSLLETKLAVISSAGPKIEINKK